MDGRAWLDDIEEHYLLYRKLCEAAEAQVSDRDFFAAFGRAPLSVGVFMKHLGGNLRSRWRGFLTSDGEKPDRNREDEFSAEGETRASIRAKWDEGWRTALEELRALTPDDLDRTITIRGEPLPVVRAIHRNLTHAAYHCGQIVQLARHLAGDDWRMLSIPPGESERFNREMGEAHGDWLGGDRDAETGPGER